MRCAKVWRGESAEQKCSVALTGATSPALRQPRPPLGFGKSLDRVTERGARHARVMREQALTERVEVALSNLAQHPPRRLVDQIVSIIQQHRRDAERGRHVAARDGV